MQNIIQQRVDEERKYKEVDTDEEIHDMKKENMKSSSSIILTLSPLLLLGYSQHSHYEYLSSMHTRLSKKHFIPEGKPYCTGLKITMYIESWPTHGTYLHCHHVMTASLTKFCLKSSFQQCILLFKQGLLVLYDT